MPRMDSFVEYTLELLEPLGAVQARSMFGGWGLYFGGRMFGLIIQGQLYLKTDDVTRADFEAEGCRPFIYQSRGKEQPMSYWTPPVDAEDDGRRLLPWARRAVDASNRAAMKKAAKKPPAAKKAPVAKKAPAAKKAPVAKKAPAAKKTAVKKAPAKRVRRS
ncbi:TfoX/Sxy family protein [Corallococcus carmarthensis]|uniref:TfoX family protein n=1 Tax=Corallococcus carmarthensis TaxID=2316728 RepID=A0A3A8KDS9_9BACT|nr:TfoX/Sxy family protein [Corallococcus carmarthensis]NOK19461.1 TfoX/Sxy family protein [Corallococcus carmarthensis]RKH02371.1 TfoX family protein [Corallococcus carmarthensis]